MLKSSSWRERHTLFNTFFFVYFFFLMRIYVCWDDKRESEILARQHLSLFTMITAITTATSREKPAPYAEVSLGLSYISPSSPLLCPSDPTTSALTTCLLHQWNCPRALGPNKQLSSGHRPRICYWQLSPSMSATPFAPCFIFSHFYNCSIVDLRCCQS